MAFGMYEYNDWVISADIARITGLSHKILAALLKEELPVMKTSDVAFGWLKMGFVLWFKEMQGIK